MGDAKPDFAMDMSDDEQALIGHLRSERRKVGSSLKPGVQVVVVVVVLTGEYMFWRTANELETSERARKRLGVE